MSGFEIVQWIEKCSEIQIENGTNNIALRRIKLFYLLPVVLLSVIIFGFLIGISIFFIIKTKYLLFSIVLTLIILLLTLFVYLIKPQYIAMKKANEASETSKCNIKEWKEFGERILLPWTYLQEKGKEQLL